MPRSPQSPRFHDPIKSCGQIALMRGCPRGAQFLQPHCIRPRHRPPPEGLLCGNVTRHRRQLSAVDAAHGALGFIQLRFHVIGCLAPSRPPGIAHARDVRACGLQDGGAIVARVACGRRGAHANCAFRSQQELCRDALLLSEDRRLRRARQQFADVPGDTAGAHDRADQGTGARNRRDACCTGSTRCSCAVPTTSTSTGSKPVRERITRDLRYWTPP